MERRAWWQGWWQSTVCLLETVEGSNTDLVEKEYTFHSPEERTIFLEERINLGVVYDVLWVTESSTGGLGHPDVKPLSPEEERRIFPSTGRSVSEQDVEVL